MWGKRSKLKQTSEHTHDISQGGNVRKKEGMKTEPKGESERCFDRWMQSLFTDSMNL